MNRFWLLAVAAVVSSLSFAETVSVIECERSSSLDYWAANDVKFCVNVMNRVFELAGVEPQYMTFGENAKTKDAAPDVICSAFRTSKLLEDYDFPLQPIGRMHYALYAMPSQSIAMLSTEISKWPRMRVGYSPVSQGQIGNRDRENFFGNAGLSAEFVEYPTSAGAVEALQNGEVNLLFLYSPLGKRPEGIVEVMPIGMRNVYFAVRKGKKELLNKLSAAYRKYYVESIDEIDELRKELLGVSKPPKRVRIAAYSRGGLFEVSPDEDHSGTVSEWLRMICGITQWSPDFVYGSFDESLRDVAEGKLDIVGGIAYAPSRRDRYRYPHTAIGMLRVYLWAHQNSGFKAGDPTSWRGMRVGMLTGTISAARAKRLFDKDKNKLGLEYAEYASDDEMRKAFRDGEIDACIDVEMPEMANDVALHLFSSSPMYICAALNKKELFLELEDALEEICDDYSKYLRMISEHHYGIHSEIETFTIKEAEWLKQCARSGRPVTIDFSPWPFDVSKDANEPSCLVGYILDYLSKKTGLEFRAKEQTDLLTAESNFLRGETELWAPYPENPRKALYGAKTVFSLPVPESAAKFYGSDNLFREFELYARKGVPEQLVSIIHKIISGIDEEEVQEMFLRDVAERTLIHRIFGLTQSQIVFIAVGGVLFFLLVIFLYGCWMMRLLKREAMRANAHAEMAKRHAQAKTRFLAMMSHELRTPLNAVIGFAEFLGKEDCDENHRKEYTKGILLSSNALLELINDILDLSKFEAGAMHMRTGACNVKQVLDELPAIFGYRVQKHGVKLIVDALDIGAMPTVKLSRQGLRQILINLVGNSAKFTQDGTITVLSRWIESAKTLHIEVKDTGCGISDEKMSRLFDPFVQDVRMGSEMREQGTGLGLPIVKKMIERAGGKICVTSKLGKGTQFIIDIPDLEIAEDEANSDQSRSGDANSGKASLRKVLVVDDVAMNRKILGIHLGNLGIKDIKYAENGEAALNVMKDWVPDIVLTDMWMPKMDGTQLAEAMRKDDRLITTPIVAVTADVDVGSTYDMKLFAKVLAKPVTGDKLKALFNSL